MSALVVDFGSYTTRAGYAGEDTPRVVCPSFYGYVDEPESSTNGSGVGGGAPDAMDVDGAPGSGANGDTNGDGDAKGKRKRKYYVGDDGVNVWRAGMEVDNFMTDSIGKLIHPLMISYTSESELIISNGRRTRCSTAASRPARAAVGRPD